MLINCYFTRTKVRSDYTIFVSHHYILKDDSQQGEEKTIVLKNVYLNVCDDR